VPEVSEEPVTLQPMTAGRVVEDYGHVGLTLREHPVSFLRRDLAAEMVLTCTDAGAARDGARSKSPAWCWSGRSPGPLRA